MTSSLALHLSSGDLVADRRLEMARDYAAGGEPGAAAELVEQALERVPGWADGWFALGEFRTAAAEAGDRAGDAQRREAASAFERALALDPADRCGASLRLARLGALPMPAVPPAEHVRALFDGYAPRFEASLVGALDYRAPQLIAAAIEAAAPGRRFAAALDLGCGTGLTAAAIADRVARLEGIDLSPAMIAEARGRGLYASLVVGEIVAETAHRPAGSYDLVVAGDVFCYFGDLGPAFAAVARVSRPGGLFVLSTEAVGEDEGSDVVLRDSLRYAHRPAHVAAAASAAGFGVVSLEPSTLRRDRGHGVEGTVAVLAR